MNQKFKKVYVAIIVSFLIVFLVVYFAGYIGVICPCPSYALLSALVVSFFVGVATFLLEIKIK